MWATYEGFLTGVTLVFEGGNDDDPRDPGGRTSRGIIQTEYDSYRDGLKLPRRDVWKADQAEVLDIYKTKYAMTSHYGDLPAGLDGAVFDGSVNSGLSQSVKWLQRVLGIADDGKFGPMTLNTAMAVLRGDVAAKVQAYCARRLTMLEGLKTWLTFGKGWARRVAAVEAYCYKLAAATYAITPGAVTTAVAAEAAKADQKSKAGTQVAAGTGTAGTATGVASASPVPVTPIERYVLIVCALALVSIAAYGAWQWYIHKHRAAAYAAVK